VFVTWGHYQDWCEIGSSYPELAEFPVYAVLGINGEVGEVREALAGWAIAVQRGDGSSAVSPAGVIHELGDVFWYLARCCTDLHISLGCLGPADRNNIHSIDSDTPLPERSPASVRLSIEHLFEVQALMAHAADRLCEVAKKAVRNQHRAAMDPTIRGRMEVHEPHYFMTAALSPLADLREKTTFLAEGLGVDALYVLNANRAKLDKRRAQNGTAGHG
jgi:NTP pyrophosphatase (non-canonical NTP hydrolase)